MPTAHWYVAATELAITVQEAATSNTFVEELVNDLVTEGIITAKSTDGFFDSMADVSGTVVAFYDNGGEADGYSPSSHLRVGVRVRSDTNYLAARRLAGRIYNRYHQMVDTTLTNWRVLSATGTLPGSIGRDDRDRSLVAFNLIFNVTLVDQTIADGDTGYGGKKDPIPEA